jgi:outer membrane biosynthesis protein TonB
VRDHVRAMSDEPPPGVLGGLPHRRPHRRSEKRAAQPHVAASTPAPPPVAPKPRPKAKPRSSRPPQVRVAKPRPSRPPQVRVAKPAPSPPPSTAGPVETAVQAAAELAEIGLSVSARALRSALARLPRP